MSLYEPASYHIVWRDPLKTKEEEILSGSCDQSNNQKNDESKLEVCPYRPKKRVFMPKDYLEVYLTTKASDTIVTASSYCRIPITAKNLRTEEKWPAVLSSTLPPYTLTEDASLVFTANIKKRWLYYQVPDGLAFVLGYPVVFNSRILIAPYDDTE
jgi:hypothetical protein